MEPGNAGHHTGQSDSSMPRQASTSTSAAMTLPCAEARRTMFWSNQLVWMRVFNVVVFK